MTFLLGRHAMLGQEPPMYRRSIDHRPLPLRGQRPGEELARLAAAEHDDVKIFQVRHGLLRRCVLFMQPRPITWPPPAACAR